MNRLEELHHMGRIQLVVSTVNSREQEESNPDQAWKEKYKKKISEKEIKPEVAMWDVSSWDTPVWGDEEVNSILKSIFQTTKLSYDQWLLETALAHDCDYFLTLDSKDFIKNGKKERIEALSIKVRKPDESFMEELSKLLGES